MGLTRWKLVPRSNQGRGGALLREKIVASSSRQLIIVVDESKIVNKLGSHGEVPVEIVSFGWQSTARRLEKLGWKPVLRSEARGLPFVTDGGHYILDCSFEKASRSNRERRNCTTRWASSNMECSWAWLPRHMLGARRVFACCERMSTILSIQAEQARCTG